MVRGDSEVKYEKVMDLMSILQSAGAEGVGLITKPPKGKWSITILGFSYLLFFI